MTNDLLNCLIKKSDKNNKDLICHICKSLFLPDQTVQLKCSHLYCKSCIEALNLINKKCPLCNKSYVKGEPIKLVNKFAYNILYNLDMVCPNHGCNMTFKLGEYPMHMDRCMYKLTDCPYCDKKNILRKDLKIHLTDNIKEHFLNLVETVEELKKKLSEW